MKFLLLLLLQPAWSEACNISDKETLIRLALMKASDVTRMSRSFEDEHPEYQGPINKTIFKDLIDQVKKVYGPIFRRRNLNFKVESSWHDDQVNAFAGVRGKDRYILLYGGYARQPLMTRDAFLSIICHEVGHHLGGFPKKSPTSWSSTEGQADYFSTLKCMKLVLKNDEEGNEAAEQLLLPDEVRKQCRIQFKDENDYRICLRSAKASEEYGQAVALIKRSQDSVSLLTPAPERASVTSLSHPSTQCRVDTKYAGALCNVSPHVATDDKDETIGTCHYQAFQILGTRPECWFVHKK